MKTHKKKLIILTSILFPILLCLVIFALHTRFSGDSSPSSQSSALTEPRKTSLIRLSRVNRKDNQVVGVHGYYSEDRLSHLSHILQRIPISDRTVVKYNDGTVCSPDMLAVGQIISAVASPDVEDSYFFDSKTGKTYPSVYHYYCCEIIIEESAP